MNWLKMFDKNTNDPDTIFTATLYHRLKDGKKKNKVGRFYTMVKKAGNLAEKTTFDLVSELFKDSDFSGVCNIRISENHDNLEKMASEFDVILEDLFSVIYLNVKDRDFKNNQLPQITRHNRILNRMIPNGKTLYSIGVIISDPISVQNFKNQLKFILERQALTKIETGRSSLLDDVFCNILLDIDKPITHEKNVIRQFNIHSNDLIDGFSMSPVKEQKIKIEGVIMDVKLRKNGTYKTDILFTDHIHFKKVYLPVGHGCSNWIGHRFSGYFVKELGKKPPYIIDFENDFSVFAN